VADQLIANDPLVSFLRAAYRVPDRYGKTPAAGKFSVRVPQGGVVKVTLTDGGPRFEAGMSASVMKSLGIHDPSDQGALGRLVADALDFNAATLEPLRLAQAAQEFAAKPTPPLAWSRFMAKLGLSCGREAYGDSWLDSRQAAILSSDLLSSEPPRFSQRSYYPPVEPVWPYVPPKHQMWIEAHDGTAVLMVVLFGQVLGAVPVSDEPPPDGAYSAWSLDPQERSFSRSSFPAIWFGTAAARLTKAGYNVLTVLDPKQPFMYVEDGQDGPANLPIPTMRADSPTHAFKILADARASQDGAEA
jgi:hypothetical protein